ncbi:MAG TPA: GNAT family N-acetyltransferase [Acidimicrobiales bacterium]|nr:GNAT family N-acetyltransferase [Acidimicrobiales bacterium]
MSATRLQVIRRGDQRARTGPWRGDNRVAYLAPAPDTMPLSPEFVRLCMDRLGEQGYERVVTSALSPGEQPGFLDAGFGVEQRLHLLAHDVSDIPEATVDSDTRIRRPRSAERAIVIELDGRVFDSFWRLDESGLDEALRATPRARFRVAVEAPGRVVGYAITGRAGRRGYLQRLAVDADRQGRGLGRALVVDGLRWLERWQVDRALVNTQVGNERALRLYQDLGFRPEPVGLSVLSIDLPR